ncbi:plasma membrane proteolipid Pmp3 [Leucoagaricus gongylophorus]
MALTGSDICKIIFAIVFPPLGVFLERGCCADLLINILLTILGYIPGIIHGELSIVGCTSTTNLSLFHSTLHYFEVLMLIPTSPRGPCTP